MTYKEDKLKMYVGLFVLVSFIPQAILSAYILTVLWDWFVVPMGLNPISVPLAMGLSVIVGYFKGLSSNKSDNMSGEELLKKTVEVYSYPLIMLLMGWVIHLFM